SGLDRLLGAFVDFVCDVCVSKTVSRPENLSVRDLRFSAHSVKGSRAPFYGWINRLDPMMLRNRAPISYHLPMLCFRFRACRQYLSATLTPSSALRSRGLGSFCQKLILVVNFALCSQRLLHWSERGRTLRGRLRRANRLCPNKPVGKLTRSAT